MNQTEQKPIPMLLICPSCGRRHIDYVIHTPDGRWINEFNIQDGESIRVRKVVFANDERAPRVRIALQKRLQTLFKP